MALHIRLKPKRQSFTPPREIIQGETCPFFLKPVPETSCR